MKIGILGAGGIGQALAGHMAKAGHEVIVSNSRGPETLAGLVRQLGPKAQAGTRQEAEVSWRAADWGRPSREPSGWTGRAAPWSTRRPWPPSLQVRGRGLALLALAT
jgi:NAD(P)-dependent dehydrogenase (short-subunit alcohol dehydrogenase family)